MTIYIHWYKNEENAMELYRADRAEVCIVVNPVERSGVRNQKCGTYTSKRKKEKI